MRCSLKPLAAAFALVVSSHASAQGGLSFAPLFPVDSASTTIEFATDLLPTLNSLLVSAGAMEGATALQPFAVVDLIQDGSEMLEMTYDPINSLLAPVNDANNQSGLTGSLVDPQAQLLDALNGAFKDFGGSADQFDDAFDVILTPILSFGDAFNEGF
ncbi:hypothetical protein I6N98_04585 [Spongiibacter nanhainus]|uniref:Uncharacterized protein n=1 Tax=Spongiibacter nanhainus TaxID=2794344 RepID=A0A7T4R295_9GAMM|nr:hypothetical protein [Spongiibacter nanhainus]QQD19136.1 hypothetical protein I6N98_04585 [Spongiibacter nanhainus]